MAKKELHKERLHFFENELSLQKKDGVFQSSKNFKGITDKSVLWKSLKPDSKH